MAAPLLQEYRYRTAICYRLVGRVPAHRDTGIMYRWTLPSARLYWAPTLVVARKGIANM